MGRLYNPHMSGPSSVAESPLTDRRDLVEYLARGARPREQWRIGTEHEKFGFRLDDLRPPTFDGERGIEALLKGLTRFGWLPVEEKGRVVALVRNGASVTLEPAGNSNFPARWSKPSTNLLRSRSPPGGGEGGRRRTRPGLPRHGLPAQVPARTCRGCPRAATRTCASTCPRSVRSAWT